MQTMQTADCGDRADWVLLFLLVPNFLVEHLLQWILSLVSCFSSSCAPAMMNKWKNRRLMYRTDLFRPVSYETVSTSCQTNEPEATTGTRSNDLKLSRVFEYIKLDGGINARLLLGSTVFMIFQCTKSINLRDFFISSIMAI